MQKSYAQILKSSALIGGISVVVILIGIVRTKLMAGLLGSAGFGVLGLYNATIDLVVAVAGMGISSSGVRQIAEAASCGDDGRIARTTTILRRTAIMLKRAAGRHFSSGVFATGLAADIPEMPTTPGRLPFYPSLCCSSCSPAVRSALIEGTRRIADLARMGVLGSLLATCFGIPIAWLLREKRCCALSRLRRSDVASRVLVVCPQDRDQICQDDGLAGPWRDCRSPATRLRLHGERLLDGQRQPTPCA